MAVSISGDGAVTGVASINTDVSSTELGYLDGVTSAIQPQIAGAGGLVLVGQSSFTAASSVSLDNVFSSTYDNYRVVVSVKGSTLLGLRVRLRAAGVDISAANSYRRNDIFQAAGATVSGNNDLGTEGNIGTVKTSPISIHTIDLNSPLSTEWKALVGMSVTDDYFHNYGITLRTATPADGLTVYGSTGTITGTVRVYGYAQ